MSEVRAFALPDVGEGLTEAEILRWHVRPGDVVKVNQMIVEIETAKASVELPCPFAGTVAELLVTEGSIVPVGSPIITVETPDAPPASERQAVLVGYGVREGTAEPRRRRRREAETTADGTARDDGWRGGPDHGGPGEAAGAQARTRAGRRPQRGDPDRRARGGDPGRRARCGSTLGRRRRASSPHCPRE